MKPLIDPDLERYVHDHTRPRAPLFDELREVTFAKTTAPEMQVGRVEGTLLKTFVAVSRARRVIEIGTFTGFSALSMAEGLPEDGELVTCDIDPVATSIARQFFDRSPHGKKITIRLGPALETLATLPDDGSFDLAFLDADKENYVAYYDAVFPKIRKGGLILADNTLWSGRVLHPETASDRAICDYNDHVQRDPRVENVLLSVRDGLHVARKL